MKERKKHYIYELCASLSDKVPLVAVHRIIRYRRLGRGWRKFILPLNRIWTSGRVKYVSPPFKSRMDKWRGEIYKSFSQYETCTDVFSERGKKKKTGQYNPVAKME